MKKILISLSVISGVIALWIILKLIPFKDILNSFSTASPFLIIGYIVVSTGIMVSLAWRWKIILKSQGIDLPFYKLLNYRIIGYGVSYLTPAAKLGGEPVRAAMLGRHGIGFSKALSSVVIDKTIEASLNGLFFFFGVIIVLFSFALPNKAEIFLLVLASILLLMVIVFYQRMMSGKGIIKQLCKILRLDKIKHFNMAKVEEFESMLIKFYKEDKPNFVLAILISMLSWVFMFLEFKFALLILGHDVSFMAIFLIVSFIGAAVLVPVPMALGVLEASQIAVFSLININTATGVALAFLVRARDLIWTVIGMLMLSYYGIKIIKTIKKNYDP